MIFMIFGGLSFLSTKISDALDAARGVDLPALLGL